MGEKIALNEVYKMEKPPECFDIVYKTIHEVLYHKVMNQLKKYRLKTVFLETLDDSGFSVLEWRRIPSIDINDIDAKPDEILCLIYNDRHARRNSWSRPYGGVL